MLEDDLHVAAVVAVHIAAAGDAPAAEAHGAIEAVEAGQGARQGRLARTRFAHDAQDLAGLDGEADLAIAGDLRGAAAGQRREERRAPVVHAQSLDLDQRLGAGVWLAGHQAMVGPRHGGKQAARVVVARCVEHRVDLTLLDQPPRCSTATWSATRETRARSCEI